MSKPVPLALALVAVAVVAVALYRSSATPAYEPVEAAPPSPRERARAPARAGHEAPARPTLAARDTPDDLVAHLRARYGEHIDEPYVQVKMLEELMRYFREREPERWQQALLEVVRQAFPERYDDIAAVLQSRIDYEAWMEKNRARLRGLDADQRRQALWEARARLFGEDAAEQIWASELRNRAVVDALAAIDAATDATLADKLAMYRQSLADVYEDRVDGYLKRHRHEAMSQFLALESVQRELSNMDPETRSRSLRDIRAGMGLDERALARWDELDRKRDRRWERGRAYMEEREALAEEYAGAELEARLDALRERYFGPQAETIAREEASGFFRFERPRRYGLN